MEDEVGTYASFASRLGRASSELREVEGGIEEGQESGMEIEGGNNNVVYSSDDEDGWNLEDETTIVVTLDPNENADKTTLVIPPDEIQGFLRETGIHSRPRKGIKVKKENGQFLCPICEHPFKHINTAMSHAYTHMNHRELERSNIYHQRCPHSPQKIFFHRQNYANHINSHEGIKNFKCHICQKGFGGKGSMERHILTHVNEGSQEVQTPLRHFQCYFCHKKFSSMSHLISHISGHTMETPFKCSNCNKWFTQVSNLNSHIRKLHSHPENPKPFPCPQCPKKYNERGQLTQHIKSVHGERLHKCPKCSKSFSYKRDLDTHVDGVHRKIRQHCPHCQKTYSTKCNMMKHIKKDHK